MNTIEEKLDKIYGVTIGQLSSATFENSKEIARNITKNNEHLIPLLNTLIKNKVVASQFDVLKMVLAFLIVEMVEHGKFSDDKKAETTNEQVN